MSHILSFPIQTAKSLVRQDEKPHYCFYQGAAHKECSRRLRTNCANLLILVLTVYMVYNLQFEKMGTLLDFQNSQEIDNIFKIFWIQILYLNFALIFILFSDSSKAVLLLRIFYVFFCLAFAMPLCASVYMCLVVTCWERADLLALVCGV